MKEAAPPVSAQAPGWEANREQPAEPETEYPPPRVRWAAVAILFLLYVLSFVDRNVLGLLIGSIKADLGISDLQASLLIGFAFSSSYAVMALPLGWAVDRFNRRGIIFAGVISWSLATVACGFTRNFGVLFGARLATGAGESALVPGVQSMLGDLFPKHQLALPLSIWSLGAKIGQGLALIIGGLLAAVFVPSSTYTFWGLGDISGWQAIFIMVGLPGFLLAFLVYTIPEPKRTGTKPGSSATYASYYRFVRKRWAFVLPHHVAKMLFLAVSVSIIGWSPSYFSRAYGWQESQVGLWLGSALLLGPLFGMPFHGFIVDRFYGRGRTDIHMRYTMWLALLSVPLCLTAFSVNNPYLALGTLAVLFFLTSGHTSIPIAAMQAILPSHLRGKAAAVMLLLINMVGGGLGPLIVAALTDYVYGDPALIGRSLMTFAAIGLPLSALMCYLSLAPLRSMTNDHTE